MTINSEARLNPKALMAKVNANPWDAKESLAMVNSDHVEDRIIIAKTGRKEHLDMLTHDQSTLVLKEVAKHGRKENLDAIISNGVYDDHLLAAIAEHGYDQHLGWVLTTSSATSTVVQLAIAKAGAKKHLDKLLTLPLTTEVNIAIAARGYKEHLDSFIGYPAPDSLQAEYLWDAIAEHGYKEHLDALLVNEEACKRVYNKIASFKHIEHLDTLLSLPDANYHLAVAKFGNKEHLDKLVDHDDVRVQVAVAERGFKEHLDKLVSSKHPRTRIEVAKKGYKDHAEILATDLDEDVVNANIRQMIGSAFHNL